MLYTMTTPNVYRKLLEEIDEAIAGGKASNPISQVESRGLPYLQVSYPPRNPRVRFDLRTNTVGLQKAVIYEGIRIHPPNQMLLPKLTPPEGDTLDGKFVPGGTKIAWNVWNLLRHKPTFGEDAYLFRPERWMEADPKKRLEMERHVELVFGYGRYVCMGKTIAMIELNKIFFEVSLFLFSLAPVYTGNVG